MTKKLWEKVAKSKKNLAIFLATIYFSHDFFRNFSLIRDFFLLIFFCDFLFKFTIFSAIIIIIIFFFAIFS